MLQLMLTALGWIGIAIMVAKKLAAAFRLLGVM